jgi:DNA (cytosine-5)-methyltransferase 1
MRGVSLFAGIGGLDCGFERAGGETILQVERDPFCQKVLAKHWPDVRRISDVHDVTAEECAGADVLFGGFPCQPVSLAGKREGQNDDRWLWPEFARLIGEVRPRYAVMENVPGLVSLGLADVLGDLAALGYDAEWSVVSACAVGAPHTRERLFIIAHAQRLGFEGPWRYEQPIHPAKDAYREANWLIDAVSRDALPFLCTGHARVPRELAADELRALGNAVVPQVAEYVFACLFEFDKAINGGG